MIRPFAAPLALGLALGITACSGSPAPAGQPAPRIEITVSAASSLTEAFGDVARSYEQSHPATKVALNLGGSPQLVSQVESGAKVDVIATADLQSIDRLSADGLLTGTARPFAGNRLAIAVVHGNPLHLSGLADLSRSGVRVALAAPGVPAGKYARQALLLAGVSISGASEEPDVKSVVLRVSTGVADAGIVYTTDIRASSALEEVAIGSNFQVPATYPIAVVGTTKHGAQARDFEAFVLSPAGQRILAGHGFLPPPAGGV